MMKRLLLSFLLLFASIAATKPKPVPEVISHTLQSLVHINHPTGDPDTSYICAGFIVNASKGWALTAAHCVVDENRKPVQDLFVNDMPTEVVKVGDMLAIVKVPMMMGPPLDLRKDDPDPGEEVVAVGFGFGKLDTAVRHIAIPNLSNDIVVDGPLFPGMSGGPIVDLDGKVVGVVQMNVPITPMPQFFIGQACGAQEIREFLKSVK